MAILRFKSPKRSANHAHELTDHNAKQAARHSKVNDRRVLILGIAIRRTVAGICRRSSVLIPLATTASHIAVLKVKRNEPLTATDLKELERIFLEAGVDDSARSRPMAGFRVSSALLEAGSTGREACLR
jgi:hypothetical protein